MRHDCEHARVEERNMVRDDQDGASAGNVVSAGDLESEQHARERVQQHEDRPIHPFRRVWSTGEGHGRNIVAAPRAASG